MAPQRAPAVGVTHGPLGGGHPIVLFDVVTTMVGMKRGLGEGNAVARAFIETYGTPGIGLLKFSALLVVVVAWARFDDRRATAVLLGFALVSLGVVALNAMTLASL